jgi:nitrogen fixation protein NifU and related proteins
MNELQDLYREVILDHNRHPRNFGTLEPADKVVDGFNPLCGDKLKLFIKLDGDRIEDIKFQGTGCAISVASSSLMTERIKGSRIQDSLRIYDQVHEMLTGTSDDAHEDLGKLAALAGVRAFPSRVKCASLAWHALKSALTDSGDPVSTE